MAVKFDNGYFGIGVYHPKTAENIGTLWRSAQNFGAAFIFTIGKRYIKQASDTTNATRKIPLFEYVSFEDFKTHLPFGCRIVVIEQTEGAQELSGAHHPESAAYLLGAEDTGIPEDMMVGNQKVFVDTPSCLNVAVAGSIVLYDLSVQTTRS